MTDDELFALVSRLLSDLEGLERATHQCACGRLYRLGISAALQSLIPVLRRALLQRSCAPAPASSASWFAWLELD